MTSRAAPRALVLLLLLGTSCSSEQRRDSGAHRPRAPAPLVTCMDPSRPVGEYRGVRYWIWEEAHDGTYCFPPIGEKKVDANATLVVSFDGPAGDEAAAADEEWTFLRERLEEIRRLSGQVAELDEREVDLSDEAAVRAIVAEANEVNSRVADFFTRFEEALKARGFADSKVNEIKRGQFPGGTGTARQVFENIARWLRMEIERRTAEGEQVAREIAATGQILIAVEATHSPVGEATRAVHVENYDTIPAGEYRPIDRKGLVLTPSEKKRLNMEIEQSEIVASSVREIRADRGRIADILERFGAQLRSHLVAMLRAFDPLSTDLETRLEELQRALENELAGNADAEELARDIGQVRELVSNLRGLRSAFEAIATRLSEAPSRAGFLELIAGADGVVDLLQDAGDLARDLSATLPAIARLPERIASIVVSDAAIDVGRREAAVEAAAFLRALKSELPATARLVELLSGFVHIALGAGELAETDERVIARPPEDLPPGSVVLPTFGVTQGDRVTVSVRFYARREDGTRGELVYQRTYRTELVLTGLHRRFSGEFIFARAVSGDAEARRWQPNVAAVVNWHYLIREPAGAFENFFDWLEPGLGLHVASLDQGEDSVEVGVGANVTFWGGLLTGGGGYNLSVADDNAYVFIGIGLLEAFEEIRQRIPAGSGGIGN